MIAAIVLGAAGAWAVFATLRHAGGRRFMYIGRHHVAGEY